MILMYVCVCARVCELSVKTSLATEAPYPYALSIMLWMVFYEFIMFANTFVQEITYSIADRISRTTKSRHSTAYANYTSSQHGSPPGFDIPENSPIVTNIDNPPENKDAARKRISSSRK